MSSIISVVRTVPASYSGDFISSQTEAMNWVRASTDGINSTLVFMYETSQVVTDALTAQYDASVDNIINNYDSLYVAWARPSYSLQVDEKLGSVFLGGFTVPTGVGAGPLEGAMLQTRNTDDRTNWLTSQAAYTAQIAAGNGAVQGASFRTANNTTISCTYSQGQAALLAMASWGASVFHRSWALKDQLNAATTPQGLETAIADLPNGWPA